MGGILVATSLGTACTAADVPTEASATEATKVEPPPPEPAQLEPPPRQPISLEPWVWYHAITPARARALTQVGVSNISDQPFVGAPRRYVAETKRDELQLRREDLTDAGDIDRTAWSTSIAAVESASAEPMVLGDPRSTDIVVGWRVDGGYGLRRYTQDGELRWEAGPADPDAFGEGHGALQLGLGGTTVVVYNRGAPASYLDEIDLESGHSVARTVVNPAVLSSRFVWPPPDAVHGEKLGHRWPTAEGSYVVRKQVKALVVDHAGPGNKTHWSTTLDGQGGSWWNSAALLEYQDTVVVVAYHGSSSGAVAHGLARRDGSKLFDASPGSIGMIGHSKYSNDLALTVDRAGLLRTHGNESGGRYIGVLDLEAGRLLGHEVWRH